MKLFFWLSFFILLYIYLGYPIFLIIQVLLRPREVRKDYIEPDPHVTIIVAARNEEKNIRKRLLNLISQDFASDKLEIIVISDGSTDRTSQIVKNTIIDISHLFENHPMIKLIELFENRGKANAINEGIKSAKGEYVVFTDARQKFESNVLRELISNFNDPTVGCVTGELLLLDDKNSKIGMEMGLYWNYEKQIRRMESRVHSVAGATGAIYAIRRSLFSEIPTGTILDDVYLPMKIILKGYRTVFDDRAIAYDKVSKSFEEEKRRKVRTLLGNYQLIKIFPELLSPYRNPIFVQYVSHKVLRLFIPFFYIGLIITSFLIPGTWYKICFISLILVPSIALVDTVSDSRFIFGKAYKLVAFSKTIVFLNYFALLAFCHLFTKSKKKLW